MPLGKGVFMDEHTKSKLRTSLISAIDTWWMDEQDTLSNSVTLPWVGENTLAYIADAALAVILALQDTQEYLEREHNLAA